MATPQADQAFLKKILMALVLGTAGVGMFAGYASVNASQAGQFSIAAPDGYYESYQAR